MLLEQGAASSVTPDQPACDVCCPAVLLLAGLPPLLLQLVERANKWCQELGMQEQVHFLFTNVSVSLTGAT